MQEIRAHQVEDYRQINLLYFCHWSAFEWFVMKLFCFIETTGKFIENVYYSTTEDLLLRKRLGGGSLVYYLSRTSLRVRCPYLKNTSNNDAFATISFHRQGGEQSLDFRRFHLFLKGLCNLKRVWCVYVLNNNFILKFILAYYKNKLTVYWYWLIRMQEV